MYTVRVVEPSEYVERYVRACLARRPWLKEVVVGDGGVGGDAVAVADMEWLPYEQVSFGRVLQGECVANAYLFRKGLIRKAELAKNVARFVRTHRARGEACLLERCSLRTVPLTVHPEDLDEVEYELREAKEAISEAKAQGGGVGKLWILKPSIIDRAENVTILKSYKRLVKHVLDASDMVQWVLQEYLERPLLIPEMGNRKFHMRVYAVAVGALRVYVDRDVLCLFATLPYQDLRKTGRLKRAMHITNTCANAGHEDFDEENQICLLQELAGFIGQDSVDLLFDRTRQCVAQVFESALGSINLFSAQTPTSFEVFGLDFLVDEELFPIILEVNAVPDLKSTGGRLEGVIERLVNGMFVVGVDALLPPPSDAEERKEHDEQHRLVLALEEDTAGGAATSKLKFLRFRSTDEVHHIEPSSDVDASDQAQTQVQVQAQAQAQAQAETETEASTTRTESEAQEAEES